MSGYIKDYRSELKSDIWLMPPLYHRVWQYLKYKVNHKENRIPVDDYIMTIYPGQHLTSVRKVAHGVGFYEQMKWIEPNPKTISKILEWLEKQEMITIDRGRGNRQYTLITLLNWGLYQSEERGGNREETPRGQGREHPVDINKNDKECIKNDKGDYASKIKNLLTVFSSVNNFTSLNKDYWNVIRETRKTGKIAESVIYNNMNKWKKGKYDPLVVEYALKQHIQNYVGKREEYTLGIMRNTTKEEAEHKLNMPIRQKGEIDLDEFNLDD